VSGFRATLLLMLSIALPIGFVASRTAVNCASPGYEPVTARLVAMHGPVATFRPVAAEPAGSSVKSGRTFDVRYTAGDAQELRIGRTYRVESDNAGSSLGSQCGPRTTFTDGSGVHARTWWQRNHVALAVVVATSCALAVAAVWLRRRAWARGEIGRLAA
jgi:hypothetical protein